MFRSTARRLTGAVLAATLTPWVTSCHRTVGVSLQSPGPLIGQQIQLKVAAGADANTLRSDGERQLVTGVTRLDGVLLKATADSVRLGTVTLRLADGRRVAGLREAAVRVTADMAASRSELDGFRTTLAVSGIAFGVLTLLAMAAIGGALNAIIGSGVRPAHASQ